MDTEIIKIDRENFERQELRHAGELIRAGALVAFPTETVYGLGGDALDEATVAKIYAAKGRPSDNPLIVHIADLKALDELASAVALVIVGVLKYATANPTNLIFFTFASSIFLSDIVNVLILYILQFAMLLIILLISLLFRHGFSVVPNLLILAPPQNNFLYIVLWLILF